ncbi:MAG: conjugal transfer protein TraX [Lachnospiraceae bacterium]|nr:conjugal transfer protein TraX [Lachnospiraceae bacterium]
MSESKKAAAPKGSLSVKENENESGRFLSRDIIKLIAMVTMLLNHSCHLLRMEGTWLGETMVEIGYFTAITMCYFMVEGYQYTRNKGQYALRLFGFGLLAQLPYNAVLSDDGSVWSYTQLNMMFSLFLCFLVLLVKDKIKNIFLKSILIFLIIAFSIFTDWALFAPVFTLMFAIAKDSKKGKVIAYAIAIVLFTIINVMLTFSSVPFLTAIYSVLLGILTMALSGVCVLRLYNGKRMQAGRTFFKWFFYLFYPGHLFILMLIRWFVL